MEVSKNSFFIRALMRFWAAAISCWKRSFLGRTVRRIFDFVDRKWKSSFLFIVLIDGGRLDRRWGDSAVFRAVTAVINCPGTFLRFVDRKLNGRLSDSALVSICAHLGKNSAVLVSWIVLTMLVIPQEYWNNMYSFAALFLVTVLFWTGCVKDKSWRFEVRSVGLFAVAYAAMVFVSFISSTYIGLSVRFLVFHLTCMAAVLLVVSGVEREEQVLRLLGFIFVGLIVAGLYGLFQKAMGIEVDEKLVDLSASGDTPGRVFSFFENPNSYAMILVLFLPAAGVCMLYCKGFMRLISVGAFLVGGVNLALTYSRGGWVAIVLAAFIVVLIMWPRFVPLLVILCVAALPLLPSTILNRLLSILNYSSDSSVTSRGALYKVMWELVKDQPILGHGLGSDVIQQAVVDIGKYASKMDFIHGHDLYLQIAGEMGVLGLAGFLGAMFASFRTGLRVITGRTGSRKLQAVIAALIAGFIGILVYGIIDYPWYYPRVMVIFWIGFGILVAAIKTAKRQEGKDL